MPIVKTKKEDSNAKVNKVPGLRNSVHTTPNARMKRQFVLDGLRASVHKIADLKVLMITGPVTNRKSNTAGVSVVILRKSMLVSSQILRFNRQVYFSQYCSVRKCYELILEIGIWTDGSRNTVRYVSRWFQTRCRLPLTIKLEDSCSCAIRQLN